MLSRKSRAGFWPLLVVSLVLASGIVIAGSSTHSAPAVPSPSPPLLSSSLAPVHGLTAAQVAAPVTNGSPPQWVHLNLTASPASRGGAVMGSTTAVGYPIIFGGRAANGTIYNDTYHFTSNSWKGQVYPGSPSPRYDASIAYNTDNKTDLMFGGMTGAGPVGDTWLFSNGNWTQVATTGPSPPARSGAGLVYDNLSQESILFGGVGANANGQPVFLNDTWVFDGIAWSQVATPVAPSPRTEMGMAFDSVLKEVVLFGGQPAHGGPLNDTWTYTGGAWNAVSVSVAPSPRYGFAMAYDVANSSLVLFGGRGSTGNLNDTWNFGGTWSQVAFAPGAAIPSARYDTAFTYNQATRCMFLFGGSTGGSALNDTWLFCVPLRILSQTPVPSLIDVNQTTFLSVKVNGGQAPYTAVWTGLPPGCSWTGGLITNSTVPLPCAPTSPGTHSINATLTDQLGNSVTSPSVNLTVNPGPAVTRPTASPSAIYVNESVTFAATASGGTGYLMYSWVGLPTGCSSQNLTTLACTPSVSGNFSVQFRATDMIGGAATSPALSYIVYAIPSAGRPTASPPAIDLGQSVIFATAGAGGPPRYSFTWLGLPSGCSSANSSTLPPCTPKATGTSSITVVVTDFQGTSATSPALSFTVHPALSVEVTITPANVTAGTAVLVQATATGGAGGDVFSWTINGAPYSATGSSFNFTPSSAGNFTFVVTVKDSVNGTAAGSSVLTVTPRPGGGSSSSSSYIGWVIGGAIAVILVALVAGLLVRSRRRRGPPARPAGQPPSP